MTSCSRREFVKSGSVLLAGVGIAPRLLALRISATNRELIEMRGDALGSRVWFDPIGLHVQPGTTVRWVVRENVHTTTAYHPRNGNHSLRIPKDAQPWDSGFLVKPGEHFEVRLSVPGVYDYFCIPHEAAGMVGRIVVGNPLEPSAEPFDDWEGKPGTESWLRVPGAARESFPSVAEILSKGRVSPGGQGG